MSREFKIEADDDGIRVDRWFKRHLADVSFNQVSRWARTGQLRLDGSRVGPGDRVATGQTLRVPPMDALVETGALMTAKPKPEPKPMNADQIDFIQGMVIHKSRHAIVLNKPPGLATQGGTGTNVHVDGMLDALQFDSKDRPKLVHRLDKDTSGVLLLARTAHAAAFFGKLFASRDTKKIYWAITAGGPHLEDALIDLPIAKQAGTGGEKMCVDEENGLQAKSRFRVIDRAADRATFVEMTPMTGRTHQLRVHAAATGSPIVGDGKYGGPESFLTGGISRKMHLHARRLVIALPEGGKLDITAELPHHFAETLVSLGFDAADGDIPPPPPPTTAGAPRSRGTPNAAASRRRGERRSRSK